MFFVFLFFFFSQKEFFSPSLKKAASFVQPFFHLICRLLIFPKIDLAKSKSQVFSKTKSHSVTALFVPCSLVVYIVIYYIYFQGFLLMLMRSYICSYVIKNQVKKGCKTQVSIQLLISQEMT